MKSNLSITARRAYAGWVMKIKRILQNNWYMLKLFFRTVPLFGIFSILFQVICGVMYNVIGNVYFVKYLVDTVEKIAKAPDLTGPLFRQLLIITVVYYVSLQVVNTINGALFNEYLHKQAETKISERLTTMVFDKAIQMDLKCYDNTDFYNELTYTINQMNDLIWKVFTTVTNLTIAIVVTACLGLTFALMDPVIIPLALLAFLIGCLFANKINKIVNQSYNTGVFFNRQMDYVNRVFFLSRFAKDFRLTNVSKLLYDKFQESKKNLHEIYEKYGRRELAVYMISTFLQKLVGEFGVISYLAYMVLVVGKYTSGSFLGLWNGLSPLKARISQILGEVNNLQAHSLYIERVRGFFDYNNEVKSPNHPCRLEPGPIKIEFRRVWFRYPNVEGYALKDVSFAVEKREKVALVGYNGAGKTTVYKLLLRLYDPERGEILVNGINIKKYPLDEYRKLVYSSLMQDFQLYATTVGENVAMDCVEDAQALKKVEDTLEECGLGSKIGAAGKGVQAGVTREFDEEGLMFSGGEKQKLAFSRCVYSDNPNILLDEFSSALDTYSEYELTQKILHLSRETTTIIITHRLTMTRAVDRIIVLDQGQVVETGSHEELMRQDRIYARLYRIQKDKYVTT